MAAQWLLRGGGHQCSEAVDVTCCGNQYGCGTPADAATAQYGTPLKKDFCFQCIRKQQEGSTSTAAFLLPSFALSPYSTHTRSIRCVPGNVEPLI